MSCGAGRRRPTLIDDLLGRHGDAGSIEPGQLDILDILTVRDNRRMSDLAPSLHVDPSTVTRTLQRMELNGLAVRVGAPDDGRVVTVHLTDEGRRVPRRGARRGAPRCWTTILGTFAPDELDQLAGPARPARRGDRATYAETVVRDRERAPG